MVVGYSVKAKGIAKDLFGNWEGFVLPVQSLENIDILKDTFKEIISKENYIKQILNSNEKIKKINIINEIKKLKV